MTFITKLENLRELAERATPGEWHVLPADSPQVMSPKNEHCIATTYGGYATKETKAANTDFIAAARNLLTPSRIDALLECVKALEEIKRYRVDRGDNIWDADSHHKKLAATALAKLNATP